MKPYNRLNPAHWLIALFSNSRKNVYLKPGTAHLRDVKYKATQRVLYWLRNPAHDFMNHIIGFEIEAREGRWNKYRGWRLAQDTGWRAGIFGMGRWLRLPWVAYDGLGIRFEFGWGDGGSLNIKLRRNSQ